MRDSRTLWMICVLAIAVLAAALMSTYLNWAHKRAEIAELRQMGVRPLLASGRPISFGTPRQYGILLEGAQVDDASMPDIVNRVLRSGLVHETVVLHDTSLTDLGLRELCRLPRADDVVVSRCPGVTTAGLCLLNCLPNLRWLSIQSNDARQFSVSGLSQLPHIDYLALRVDESSVAELARLHHIASLDIYVDNLTDDVMKELLTIDNLSGLVFGTAGAGTIERFRNKRWDVTVVEDVPDVPPAVER